MDKFKEIYKKYREPLLYIIVGGLTTIVSFAAQWLFSEKLHITPVFIATALSWLCAVNFAFFLDKLVVFKSASLKPKILIKEMGLFYGARLVSGGFEVVSMGLLCDVLGMKNVMLAKAIVSVFVIIMNYIFSKFFIFNKDKNKAA